MAYIPTSLFWFMLRGRISLAILVSLVLISGLFLINVIVDDAFAGKGEKRVVISGVSGDGSKVKLATCTGTTYRDGTLTVLVDTFTNAPANGGGTVFLFVLNSAGWITGSCVDILENPSGQFGSALKVKGMTKVQAGFL